MSAHANSPSPIVVEQFDSLDFLEDDWRELAQRSDNIFSTWEWNSIWWRQFRSAKRMFIVRCRYDDGRLLAILPLLRSTKLGLRIVRFMGYGVADELGPICAPAETEVALRVLSQELRNAPWSYDIFLGERLPGRDAPNTVLGGTVVRREESPVLMPAGKGWNDYLSGKSSNLRQQVRRKERRLSRKHKLHYRLASDPSHLDDDLDILFALHAARWNNTGSLFIANEGFHRQFARRALEKGWLRLWFLELDGVARAAWYGFRFGGVESFYQSGRDTAWAHSSVGFVLLAHTIREALDDGVREYRFLRGGEELKYRFADRDRGLDTIGVSSTIAGRIALAGSSIARARPMRKVAKKVMPL